MSSSSVAQAKESSAQPKSQLRPPVLQPSASREEWEADMRGWSERCRQAGELHMSACALLALGDVHAAVERYAAAGQTQQALALATARLSPTDELLTKLRRRHASQLASQQPPQCEAAAALYLLAGDASSAVAALAAQDTPYARAAAAQIMQLGSSDDSGTAGLSAGQADILCQEGPGTHLSSEPAQHCRQ